MENNIKKYFNVLRNNEDLSYGGLRTLKIIEDEFDNMNRALAKQSNENGTLPIPDVIPSLQHSDDMCFHECPNCSCRCNCQTQPCSCCNEV